MGVMSTGVSSRRVGKTDNSQRYPRSIYILPATSFWWLRIAHAYHKESTGVKAAAGARAGRAIVTAMSVYCHITSPDSPLVPHGGSYELWWLEQEFRAVAIGTYDTQTLPQPCMLADVRLPHEIRWRMQGANVQDQQIDCISKGRQHTRVGARYHWTTSSRNRCVGQCRSGGV